jgi:hypothetical protein
MSLFRSFSIVVPVLLSSAAIFACGGATAPSGVETHQPQLDADTAADGATISEEAAVDADAGVLVGDASPPTPTCTGGGKIVSCDYPGHTGERSNEVQWSQIQACGFADCGAYCIAENPGQPGVRCITEEGTAKMYCTCLNP